jgi:hypothetical protein
MADKYRGVWLEATTFKLNGKTHAETVKCLTEFCAEAFPDAQKRLSESYLAFSPTGFYAKDAEILQSVLGEKLKSLAFVYELQPIHTEAYAIVLPGKNAKDRAILGALLDELRTVHRIGHTYHNISTPNLTLALYEEDEEAETALNNASRSTMPCGTLEISDFHLLGKTVGGEVVVIV